MSQIPEPPQDNSRSSEESEITQTPLQSADILWMLRSSTTKKLEKSFAQSKLNYVNRFCDNPVVFYELLLKLNPSIVVVENGIEVFEALDLLRTCLREQPETSRIWMVDNPSMEQLQIAANEVQVAKVISPLDGLEILSRHLELAFENSRLLREQKRLSKEVSQHNRALEKLTYGLEKMVNERTLHIENSNEDEKQKLAKMRKLVSFIKTASEANSFEEALIDLRREFKSFHKIGEPLLIEFKSPGISHIHYFSNGQVMQAQMTTPIEHPTHLLTNDGNLSRSLANHFGRPFGRVIALPLEAKLTSAFYNPQTQVTLCFENSLSDGELPSFLEFLQDRSKPIGIALDKILLQSLFSEFSYRWEKTFDGIKDPIAIIDDGYRLLRANKNFSKIGKEPICYKTFADSKNICPGCPVFAARKEGVPKRGQVQVQDKTYEVYTFPIASDLKVNGRVINHYVDITESRKLYLRMIQNEKMGAIGQLAGNIAHELNNPLTGLRSLSQVMMTEIEVGSQLHSDLMEIEKAAGRSQKIIHNLLEFSQPSVGEAKSVRIDEIVQNTMPMLKTAIRHHKVAVELRAGNSMVKVEPQLLSQVIFNLVNNACQAMASGGYLSISTDYLDNLVYLRVKDSGPGIPESIQEKIFEPFFTTKKEGQGTGLGLSFVKNVVERFGGKIWVQSQQGQGSEFTIELNAEGAIS